MHPDYLFNEEEYYTTNNPWDDPRNEYEHYELNKKTNASNSWTPAPRRNFDNKKMYRDTHSNKLYYKENNEENNIKLIIKFVVLLILVYIIYSWINDGSSKDSYNNYNNDAFSQGPLYLIGGEGLYDGAGKSIQYMFYNGKKKKLRAPFNIADDSIRCGIISPQENRFS
jgi:hypothetical protein